MSPTAIMRAIIPLLFVAVMVYQAIRASSRSYKRRAFGVAAGAFAVLALFNIKVALESQTGPWWLAVLILFFVLLFVSLVLLIQAWRSGEMHTQIEQAQQAVQHERERRGVHDPKKPDK